MNVTLIAAILSPAVPTLACAVSIVLHRNQYRKLGEKLDATFDGLDSNIDAKIGKLGSKIDDLSGDMQTGFAAFHAQQKADMLRILELFPEYTQRPSGRNIQA